MKRPLFIIIILIAALVAMGLARAFIGNDFASPVTAETGTPIYFDADNSDYVFQSHDSYLDWRGMGIVSLLHGDLLGDARVAWRMQEDCEVMMVRGQPVLVMLQPLPGFICKQSSQSFVIGGYEDMGRNPIDIPVLLQAAKPGTAAAPMTLDIVQQWVLHYVGDDHRHRSYEKIALDVDPGRYGGVLAEFALGESHGWLVQFSKDSTAAASATAAAQ